MTFEEFVEFYNEKGFLPNDVNRNRTNVLNEKQLKTRYTKYKKSREFKEIKIDEEWENVKSELNLTYCHLLKKLKEDNLFDEINILKNKGSFLLNIIDAAHIFPKSGYPYLKYDIENIVPLNRFSHSCLDSMRDPITGEQISKEQHTYYWMYIAGIETYKKLEEKIDNYVN